MIITRHAIERYIERVNPRAHKREAWAAIDAITRRCPPWDIDFAVIYNGTRYAVRDGVVTTVLTREKM